MRKNIKFIIAMLLMVLLTGCGVKGAVQDVAQGIETQIMSQVQKQNPYVEQVKGGYLSSNPDLPLGEAFAQFFSNPTWIYFEATTGEHVVEFTGDVLYADTEVKARLQFVVKEGEDTFDIGALAFNDVPQNQLMTTALLEAVFEENQVQTEVANSEVEWEAATDTEEYPKVEEYQELEEASSDRIIYDAEVPLTDLGTAELEYFKAKYPACFESHLQDYEMESCLYFATQPEKHKAFEEFWMGTDESTTNQRELGE